MGTFETVTLSRECIATMIPNGDKSTLQKGSRVHITQSLGGSFTVMTEQGYMVRVEGADADAIGKDRPEKVKVVDESGKGIPIKDLVWGQLKTCFDPEIPVNIVDLGLVYECEATPIASDPTQHDVHVKMTLTAPGCGMGDSIRMDATQKIQSLSGVQNVVVDLVWEPQWDRSMMSEAAKLQLGLI
jgi:probable FeS assembly SUF system protein SufT